MCTAVSYRTRDFYFGRTLDYDLAYGEAVTVTPRNFLFKFCRTGIMDSHYAMIGMAHVAENYPLYYDGVNEKGLGMAGLNFVGNACYREEKQGKYNVASYEFIPWILGQCASVKEAKELLKDLNLISNSFSREMPPAQLHWMIADREETITVESTESGVHVYQNPVGVLTNNPPFEEQLFYLNNHMALSPREPCNNFSSQLPLKPYSRGMGALGLPGDWSSQSRFARAAFVKLNAVSGDSELESVNQFFHIMGTVDTPRGCCDPGNGKYEITYYTSCCNGTKGIYYYTTYGNHQITAVDMYNENLYGSSLIRYELVSREQILMQN